ncbi:N-6 DNA methylase [Undibacterium sp. Rencai35W]|uniref:N-6 DNA methylase n=1 Tax=Undibacterium sp. Rencai35W TaxID=3413046 RepID=UPI003BF4351B
MDQLSDHNSNLRTLFDSLLCNFDSSILKAQVNLDQIDVVLRSVLSIKDMRQAGSFFTGDELATEVARSFKLPVGNRSVILDPTCGAGNLLIACSRQIDIQNSLVETLKHWGLVLRGYDLYPSFVEATKLRLILEAVHRGCRPDCSIEKALTFFPFIEIYDATKVSAEKVKDVTHIIMNPPFSIWPSPKRDFWRPGKVNAAGIIFEHYANILPDNCEISAILPEVLRSGSRYDGWRNFVENHFTGDIQVVGRFNAKTDVDVFKLQGVIRNSMGTIDWHTISYSPSVSISNFFDVSVGRLVAYRDPELGPSYPYIHPKNVPLWKTIIRFDERRKFQGTVISPPFVVIRRTSSPQDKYRASGAIIVGKEPVAVENHLIIIKPKNNTIKDCNNLLKILKSPETNAFLNDRIRCRHLTVGAVKQIPYLQNEKSK